MSELTAIPGLLVIDDERAILDVVGIVARRAGLLVWTAGSGLEALSVFSRHRAEISLVLCDVRMPGLDGPATVAQIRQAAPDVRVCFMTGNSGVHSLDALLALGALRIYEKPFNLARLGDDLFELASAGRVSAA
jgi:DNA-binding NtrC family response regulator